MTKSQFIQDASLIAGLERATRERADRSQSMGALRAFTLIELLVVLAVILILIGIFLPVFGRAKDMAKDAVCLSDHRQFGIAFAAYAADFGQFPVTDYESPHTNRLSWAGVDWYDNDFHVPLLDQRPLNPYLGAEKNQKMDFKLFHCPRDNGMRHTKTDEIVNWWELYADHSNAPDPYESVYGVFGTSYAANEWMWVKPQSRDGYGLNPWPGYKRDMAPDDVLISPCYFVMVTDHGADAAGRLTLSQRLANNTVYGWWHGYEMGLMTFLDGSARRHRMGAVKTKDYSFWSNPDVQWHGGYRP